MEEIDIKSLNLKELTGILEDIGEKPFRAKQIYQWIHEKGAASYDDMTNISKQLKEKLKEHYEKHGKAMGFASAEEYLAAANAVILNEEALHKTQKDEDDVYYLEETNDFVVVSPQGYLRTYFRPEDGIKYYRRQ